MFDLDRLFADHLATGINHGVMDGRGIKGVIGDGVHFSGLGIEMGVGREGVLQCATKGIMRERVEFVVQAHGPGARLDQGPCIAIVADDIGVGIVLCTAARAGRGCFAKRGRHRVGTDPAIAIPERLAVPKAYPVDHAVAGKPVIGGRVGLGDRVWADAQVATVEGGRDFAGHGQVFQRHLCVDWHVDSGEECVVFLAHPGAGSIELDNLHDAFGDILLDQGFDGTGHWKTPGLKHGEIMFTALT